ncbi:hypothetical protein MNBD_GAMMA12-1108 [hydrothermal vent metagenome]|uniref:Zinc finger CHCC-type domain-containing protein n=1 Tax=hydrothermal vent metagenome TaxID=652676 RepID=A0A3B0Z6H0_9ZZZZ
MPDKIRLPLMEPNAVSKYQVKKNELPLHCPLPNMSKWNSHPRVYLPIEESGHARCPYCSAEFVLLDD